jgi:hypothetical protein
MLHQFAALWKGVSRIAALLPLVFTAPAGVQTVEAFQHGANLPPLVFTLTAPFPAARFVGVAFVRTNRVR